MLGIAKIDRAMEIANVKSVNLYPALAATIKLDREALVKARAFYCILYVTVLMLLLRKSDTTLTMYKRIRMCVNLY